MAVILWPGNCEVDAFFQCYEHLESGSMLRLETDYVSIYETGFNGTSFKINYSRAETSVTLTKKVVAPLLWLLDIQ